MKFTEIAWLHVCFYLLRLTSKFISFCFCFTFVFKTGKSGNESTLN